MSEAVLTVYHLDLFRHGKIAGSGHSRKDLQTSEDGDSLKIHSESSLQDCGRLADECRSNGTIRILCFGNAQSLRRSHL